MAIDVETKPGSPDDMVKQVAQVIRTFNRQELNQLIELVPELERIATGLDIHFGGLTLNEFLSMPDREKNRLWEELVRHSKVESASEHYEKLLQKISAHIQLSHSFSGMSKEEILDILRVTREEVWAEEYGN